MKAGILTSGIPASEPLSVNDHESCDLKLRLCAWQFQEYSAAWNNITSHVFCQRTNETLYKPNSPAKKTIISILLPLPADDFPASKYDYCYCDSFLKDENAVLIDFISCLVRQQLLFLVTSGQDFSCGHVRKKNCGYFLTLLVKSPL